MVAHEKGTMIKVPCGGFKLDSNFLDMNENDELSLTGGSEDKAYQYLVTDGNGNTKWEDRLAYETDPVLKEILPEQSFTGTSMKLTGGSKLSIGQTYTVKFDNTEYECICVDLSGVPAIGNATITGAGSDTGEPFLLGYVNGRFLIFVIDETSTHTVSITCNVKTFKKIDDKFLSKELIVNVAGEESDELGNKYLLFDETDDEINNALANGITVKLNYNGLNLQYGSGFKIFWGVFPSLVSGDGIIELRALSVEKSANGWLYRKTLIDTSTKSTS